MRPYPTSKCRCWNPARAHDDPSCPVNRERRRERERANRLMRSIEGWTEGELREAWGK